jgi:hypothetical protein
MANRAGPEFISDHQDWILLMFLFCLWLQHLHTTSELFTEKNCYTTGSECASYGSANWIISRYSEVQHRRKVHPCGPFELILQHRNYFSRKYFNIILWYGLDGRNVRVRVSMCNSSYTYCFAVSSTVQDYVLLLVAVAKSIPVPRRGGP